MYQDPESVLDDVRPARARRAALDGVLGQPNADEPYGSQGGPAGQPLPRSAPAPAPHASQAPSSSASGQTAADRALTGAIGGQSSQQPTGPDSSAWNTDGYSKPGHTAQATGGPLAGWDAAKWADPNHQTPKYVVGRIMASHDTRSPEGRAALIADIQKAYPGATFNGKDKVSIPGVGNNIDIFGNAAGGAFTPQWLTEEGQQTGAAGMGSAFDGFQSNNRTSPYASSNTQPGGDALQAIYQMLPGLFGDLGVQANMGAIQSGNQQTGGDSLQAIYQLLPGLMENL